MRYGMNTITENVKTLDKFANQEDTVFVRVFYKGKFINYFFEPSDVENLGLGNIFDSIDPDPDWIEAKKAWDNFNTLPTPTRKKLAKPAKKKPAKLTAAR
jgi:hypothetical protein